MNTMGLTVIDLFCGAGGKSLGFHQEGFVVLAAVDDDPHAVATFNKNLPNVPHVFQRDLRKFPPEKMAKIIGRTMVDVLIGAPPCQGFSNVRRRDGKNHGNGVIRDSRRGLYRDFFRYVGYFHPEVFVMENVPGLRTASGGRFYKQILKVSSALGYSVQVEDIFAANYGVPQKRRRIFFIGMRSSKRRRCIKPIPTHTNDPLLQQQGLKPYVTTGTAIMDLPPLQAGEGLEECEYDMERRDGHAKRYGVEYLRDFLEVHKASLLTAHRARPHGERDLRDFARLREGENSKFAEKRGIRMEFPYSRINFHDRYTRQHRNHLCSTIVAHLSKDGLMFIHPTQNRSLTPREAARIQSFPDWFQFPVERTHQFRLIGNAVPPLVARAVAKSIRGCLI